MINAFSKLVGKVMRNDSKPIKDITFYYHLRGKVISHFNLFLKNKKFKK
jgi:hypothetical protein